MENNSGQRCLNCVYYHHYLNNGYVGACCIGTEIKDFTQYDSHCNRWISNKNKYITDLDEVK